MFRALYSAPYAALLVDHTGRVLECNLKAKARFGVPEGRSMADFAADPEAMRSALRAAACSAEAFPLGLSHDERRSSAKVWAVRRAAGEVASFVIQEDAAYDALRALMAEDARNQRLKAAARQLKELAMTDMLSGLLNRRGFFFEVAGRISAPKAKGCLAFVDLDDFKSVNDRFGHETGDAILCVVSKRLSRHCRAGDILARVGGDEFVIWLAGASPEEAGVVAQRLVRAIAEPITPQREGLGAVEISASVGLAPLSPECPDVETLMRVADAAMYAVKPAHSRRAAQSAVVTPSKRV